MRYADDQDLAGDGMTAEERKRYQSLTAGVNRVMGQKILVGCLRVLFGRHCPAAVPALERAEAQLQIAIEEMRRDLALLMGDEA